MESTKSIFSYNKYWQIIQRRWAYALGIFFPVFLLSLLVASFKKPVYEAEGKLLFQRTNTISSLTGVGTEIGKLEPVVQDNKTNPLNTEAELIRSIPVVQKTIDSLQLKDNKGTSIKVPEVIKNLNVSDIAKTDILKVSYQDKNPETAAKVVNTLMNVYLEYNVTSHRMEATSARKFIEKQLPNAELVVRQAEAELAEFKEKNKIVSLQEEASKSLDIITDLQKQISQSQSQIADVNAQSQSLSKQLGVNIQQAIAMTSLRQSPGVQDILKEVQQLESQLATRRTVLQETHPEIINLKNKLAALKEILQQRIKQVVGTNKAQKGNLQTGALQEQLSAEIIKLESTRMGLISQSAALYDLQKNYKQRLNVLPRLEQQQRQLERKVQAAQSTYTLLLQKLQESRIAENQNVGNASKISEAAIPQEAISSPAISYMSAGILGILSALATIYLLEAGDKSIKTVDEAKELLGLTLLGVIPSFNKSKKSNRVNESELFPARIVVRDTPRSPISEAYRMLRANLNFVSADKQLKVIVVTSSVPREGKSTVSANLAVAMAQMERKILLIDADLHCPVQHKIWEIHHDVGLSNLIVGQIETTKAIKNVMKNLDVLTSGVVPPSPASLLDSKRMATLIESFAAEYDFVIIDAPSLNVAADAATLGQMADGVLLIVRPGVVNNVNATVARDLLEKSGQNVLGQVVNGVIPQNESHSYYYFSEEYYSQESDTINKSTRIQ